jgi:hypothetical protein
MKKRNSVHLNVSYTKSFVVGLTFETRNIFNYSSQTSTATTIFLAYIPLNATTIYVIKIKTALPNLNTKFQMFIKSKKKVFSKTQVVLESIIFNGGKKIYFLIENSIKHSSLFGTYVSYEENEVLFIWPLLSIFISAVLSNKLECLSCFFRVSQGACPSCLAP